MKQKKQTQPGTTFINGQSKDNPFLTQDRKLVRIFLGRPTTMFQATETIGIERSNIYRFIEKLRKEDTIYLIVKKLDPLTGFKADSHTTNLGS
jgi:hypothetical protein